MRAKESLIQQAFIKWCWLNERKYPELRLGFAVPNQGQRDVRNARRMKAEGMRAGVPDWMLPIPSWNCWGLAIEFKAPGGKLTELQKQYHELLRTYDWRVEVCYDWKAAADIVLEYLK
jgi:hypothetical protein